MKNIHRFVIIALLSVVLFSALPCAANQGLNGLSGAIDDIFVKLFWAFGINFALSFLNIFTQNIIITCIVFLLLLPQVAFILLAFLVKVDYGILGIMLFVTQILLMRSKVQKQNDSAVSSEKRNEI